jgi:hypothetical protein
MKGEVVMNPSRDWSRAMPPGPDARVKITEEYAKHVARDAYFWAWPLVNMYNRRLFFATITEMAYVGPLPQAPLNTFGMLTDYILVADVVQPVPLLRSKRDQSLLGWHKEQGFEAQSGRVADDLRAGRFSAGGSTRELAAGTERRRLLPVHARLLAKARGH